MVTIMNILAIIFNFLYLNCTFWSYNSLLALNFCSFLFILGPGAHDHSKFTAVKPSKPSFKITNTFFVDPNFTGGPYAVI